MAIVGVDDSSLQADSWPKLVEFFEGRQLLGTFRIYHDSRCLS